MGTEVLRPQDCLMERIRGPSAAVFHRRRNYTNHYHYNSHHTKPSRSKPAPVRFDHKRKASDSSSAISRRHSSEDLRQPRNNHNSLDHQFVKGQITILKRGEVPATVRASAGNDLIVSGTERLGPHPAMVPKQIRINDPKTGNRSRSLSPKPVAGGLPDMYAGSAFSVSPSPESLPLPSFSKKKQVPETVDDSATRDLRRLLRLE